MLPADQRFLRSLANLGYDLDDEKEDNVVDLSKTSTPPSDKPKEDKDVKSERSDATNDEILDKESKDADTVETLNGMETRDMEIIEIMESHSSKKKLPHSSIKKLSYLSKSKESHSSKKTLPHSSKSASKDKISYKEMETLQRSPINDSPVAYHPEPLPRSPINETPVASHPEPLQRSPINETPVASHSEPLQRSPINDNPVAYHPEPLPRSPINETPVASHPEPLQLSPINDAPVASCQSPEPPPVNDEPEAPPGSPEPLQPLLITDTPIPPDSPEKNYPADIATLHTRIEYVKDDIEPGMYVRVVNACILTPDQFYVILEENAPILQDLIAKLQEYFQNARDIPLNYGNNTCHLVPPLDLLIPGLPVGVRHPSDNKWHRGLIIKQLPQAKLVRIYFIDNGDFQDTNVWNLQLIPERFIKAMKAQAIRCCVFIGKRYNYRTSTGVPTYFNSGGEWTVTEGDILRRLVQGQSLGLKFIQEKQDVFGQYWLVYIHIMKSSESRTVAQYHVEQHAMFLYRDFYFPHEDDYRDTISYVPFAKLTPDEHEGSNVEEKNVGSDSE